jgi:hypothetical protein
VRRHLGMFGEGDPKDGDAEPAGRVGAARVEIGPILERSLVNLSGDGDRKSRGSFDQGQAG